MPWEIRQRMMSPIVRPTGLRYEQPSRFQHVTGCRAAYHVAGYATSAAKAGRGGRRSY